ATRAAPTATCRARTDPIRLPDRIRYERKIRGKRDPPSRPVIAPMRDPRLSPLNLHHLERFRAAGGDNLDRIPLLLAHQGAGEGRRDGDALLLGVGLGLADDLPYLL